MVASRFRHRLNSNTPQSQAATKFNARSAPVHCEPEQAAMRGYLTGLRVTTGNRNLKTNPYEPAATESASAFPNEGTSLWKSVAVGDCSSIAWSFPITALLGLLFRFPVPFGTIEGGLDHVIPSLFALLFYGVFTGGFIVIGIGGVTVGLIVHFAAGRDSPAKLWAIFLLSALVPGFCLFVLAIPEQF